MKVLAYTSPTRGHLFPLVPILNELHQRGHEIAVRTLISGLDALRGLGFKTAPIDPRIEAIAHDDFKARTPVGSVKRSAAVFLQRAEFEVDDIRAAIAAETPDVVVVDINCWGAVAVAEMSGLPWATVLPYPAPFPGKARCRTRCRECSGPWSRACDPGPGSPMMTAAPAGQNRLIGP